MKLLTACNYCVNLVVHPHNQNLLCELLQITCKPIDSDTLQDARLNQDIQLLYLGWTRPGRGEGT